MMIPTYEDWKPRKGEVVLVSMDGKKWSAQFFYEDVSNEYPDRPYRCAQIICIIDGKLRYDYIYAYRHISRVEMKNESQLRI